MSEEIYRLVPESTLRTLFATAVLGGKHLSAKAKNAKTREFLDCFAWCKPVVVTTTTTAQQQAADPTQAPKSQQAAVAPTPPFSAEEVAKAAQ